MPQQPRPRGTLHYSKPPMGHADLVAQLSTRGLDIPDANRATRYLRNIGYYRLSPYAIPFQQGTPDHAFRPGAQFDDLLDLYAFDRTLRLLVMDALERVEVAVRASLTDYMSTSTQDAHWYTDGSLTQNQGKHQRLLQIVRKTCDDQLRGAPDNGADALVQERRARRLSDDPDLTRHLLLARVNALPDRSRMRLYPVLALPTVGAGYDLTAE
ncbi:Abi family protein [Arthrobacter sp. NA-172]|uniref:Abi family protein n=1 Tax=Arthrobacter sp. NA-172 TaxID=3367524 RepID=UPI003754B902